MAPADAGAPEELQLVQRLDAEKERAWCVAWSPSGRTLATCGSSRSVRLWQQRGGADGAWDCTAILGDLHQRTVRCVAWSPCERYLASASFDATVGVWHLVDGEWDVFATLEGHENEVKCVAWSPSGTLLATCGRDRSVWIWELVDDDFECMAVLQGHSQDVKSVAWHPHGERLVSCSYDDTVRVWAADADGEDWGCAQTLSAVEAGGDGQGHRSTVWAAAFEQPSGARLATCSDDRTVRLWRCGAGGADVVPAGVLDDASHGRTIFSLDWSPAGAAVATGAGDNWLRVFAERDGGWSCVAHAELVNDVNCVRWHPRQRDLLATACDDGSVAIWRWSDAARWLPAASGGAPQ